MRNSTASLGIQGVMVAISEKVELNKSQNNDIEIPCTRCSGKTTHKVLTSVDVRGEETDGPYSIQWCDDYQILECVGCKTKSFRNVSSNSEDYYQISETEYDYQELELLYPSRREWSLLDSSLLPKVLIFKVMNEV